MQPNGIFEASKKQQTAIEHDTEIQCAEMLRKSKVYRNEASEKSEKFYENHAILRELLRVIAPQRKLEQEANI